MQTKTMTTVRTLITAAIIPAQGVTKDDVHAAVLLSQHERALVEDLSVTRVHGSWGFSYMVRLTYGLPADYAETRDAADRIKNLTGIGSVYVRPLQRA